MMYWTDGSWGWGGWLLMVSSMLLFWGLLVWLAIGLLRGTRADQDRQTPADDRSPEDVLAQRFAQGEIDENDYRQRMEVLRKERAHTG